MASTRFLAGEAAGFRQERKLFNSIGKNRAHNQAGELLELIASIFRIRCTSFVPFEDIFECIKRNAGTPWRYIEGDRSLLRAFIQNYGENFEFPNDLPFTRVVWKPNNRLVAKNEAREMQIKKRDDEDAEEKERWDQIYKRYVVVYEYEALNMLLALFHHSARNKLHFDFIRRVLQSKLDSSYEYAELFEYIGPSVKQFMINRCYLFIEENDYCTLRPNYYTDVVYHLNEFLLDLNQQKVWKPLDLLIRYYRNSPQISSDVRADMNLNTRDNFLSFLQSNRFVFGLRLLKDFEVSSNLIVPHLDWETVGKDRKLVCDDFDDLLKQYDDERQRKEKLLANAARGYSDDENDEYFAGTFSPENATFIDDEAVVVQQGIAQVGIKKGTTANVSVPKTVPNGAAAVWSGYPFINPSAATVAVHSNIQSRKYTTTDDDSRLQSIYDSIALTTQKILKGSKPIVSTPTVSYSSKVTPVQPSTTTPSSTKVQLSLIRKHFLSDSADDDFVFSPPPTSSMYVSKNRLISTTIRPKISPQNNKPLLPPVRHTVLKMDALKPAYGTRQATVRRPATTNNLSSPASWEDEIENELDGIVVE